MSFLIYYSGYTFGTEHKKFKEVDGVLCPQASQRLKCHRVHFAEYNVKEVKLNQTLGDDTFDSTLIRFGCGPGPPDLLT